MRKIGNMLIAAGILFLVAALALVLRNRQEDLNAGQAARQVLPQLVEEIGESESTEAKLPDPYDPEMTVGEIDGEYYVGFLSIPSLELELPIMSEWDYPRLKRSPCRYSGSSKTDDLTIAAHNYKRHFGGLKQLKPGEEVVLTDMDGIVTRYEVAAIDVLTPTAVEEMTAGEYDLTLFTCTYGGENRITVRCDRKESGFASRRGERG